MARYQSIQTEMGVTEIHRGDKRSDNFTKHPPQEVSLLSSCIACLLAVFPLSTSARRRVFTVSGLALARPVYNMRFPSGSMATDVVTVAVARYDIHPQCNITASKYHRICGMNHVLFRAILSVALSLWMRSEACFPAYFALSPLLAPKRCP